MGDKDPVFVQMALKAWNGQVNIATRFFSALSDEDLMKEVAPGKNRIIYLLGHLIAVNDNMISLFGLGERQYAAYDLPFLKSADKAGLSFPDAATLRADWQHSNEMLSGYFASLTPAQWLEKHSAMSDDDLLKDPARNKLSVLLSRTNHLAYHIGQLVLAK